MGQVTEARPFYATLLLCSHGGRNEGAGMARLIAALKIRLPAWELQACSLYGAQPLEAALAQARGKQIVIVPFLMAEGLTYEALQKRVAAFGDPRPVLLRRPVGTHGAIAKQILAMAKTHCDRAAWRLEDTALLLIAHGTKRHAASRKGLEALCRSVGGTGCFGDTRFAFLEESPSIDETLAALDARTIIAVGCFAEAGTHGAGDVPEALRGDPRPIAYLGPIGEAPWIEEIVLRRAFGDDAGLLQESPEKASGGEVHAAG